MKRLGFALLLVPLAALPSLASEPPCAGDEPGPLWGATLVHDPVRDEILLFGGARARRDFVGGTWTWDGASWRCHEVAGPSPRAFAGAAFDPDRKLVVLHGGRGSGNVTLGDTWGWDGSGWLRLAEEGPALDHHRVSWSPGNSALLAFGGWGGTGVVGETFLWNGRVWESLHVDGPPPRSAFAMAADPIAGRVVVHGGLWIDGQYADAWAWDGTLWEPLWGPHDHSSMDHHSMVFDRARRRFVLFGGKNYRYRPLGRTLSLEGSELRTVADDGPPARHSAGFTYDEKRSRAVLYGGKVYEGDEQVALGDLWLWDGTTWSEWSDRLEFPQPIP